MLSPMHFARWRAAAVASLAILTACGDGPSPETLLDELRVVATVVEPAELRPGETATATVTVADPVGEGIDLLVWTCTRLGPTCAEAGAPGWPLVPEVVDGQAVIDAEAPAALQAAVDELGAVQIEVWSLACAPGVCPIIDEARAGADLGAALSDPTSFLADLPIEGVSLGAKRVWVSNVSDDERHVNPTLESVADGLLSVDRDGRIDLAFNISPGATIYPVTTAGGFQFPSIVPQEDTADVVWFAPEDAGVAELYVVATDDRGGAALWRETVEVR